MTVYIAEIGGYEESEIIGVLSTDEKAVERVRARWGLVARAEDCPGSEPRMVRRWVVPYDDDHPTPTYFWATITSYEIDGDGEP
jgi:hypothetical protein